MSSANPQEIAKFNAIASRWWDVEGEMRPLHDLNPARVAYIARQHSLDGARVLDVGCGGGILSEALAREGAAVTGIDAAEKAIKVAKLHAMDQELSIDYQQKTVEQLAQESPQPFDLICCLEMLEHVDHPDQVIASFGSLLKPGGVLVLSTLNRNPLAFAGGIVAAEYVLKLLPKGTHEYAKFIKPSELDAALRAADLTLTDVRGLHYNPLTRQATTGGKPRINYLATARK